MDTVQKRLTKEYLARLELLSLNIKNRANAGYAGARKSNAKGNALEFADFRDYAHGDDIRRIDWNSFGRFDKLFIKLFTEEKQARVNIFLDVSRSMDFGEKFVFAKLAAASIAYIAIKNADNVHVFCCTDRLTVQKANVTSKSLFTDLVRFLDEVEAEGQTSLANVLREGGGLWLGQGISFIISDFFFPDGVEEIVKLLQSKRQQVGLIHVLDESEINPTTENALRLIDIENSQSLDIFIDTQTRKMYQATLQNFQNELRRFCEKRGVHYAFATSGTNILKLLTTLA